MWHPKDDEEEDEDEEGTMKEEEGVENWGKKERKRGRRANPFLLRYPDPQTACR
jgi:hypothetical protein